MDTTENLPLVFMGLIVVLNVAASVSLLSSPLYNRPQKLAQCAIIWLIPILGAVGIWVFLRVQYHCQKYDTCAYPQKSGCFTPLTSGSGDGGGGYGGGEAGGD